MSDLSKLRDPFPADDVEWRVGRAGKTDSGVWAMCLAYINNRAIMERLDEVCGPENWRNEYREAPAGGVLCGLSIRCGEEWVTKWDGADNTDMEAVKGGLSGAMKRAGAQWGIGRYLYNLPEGWAKISANGAHFGKIKDGPSFKWDPPDLPPWALPGGNGKPGAPAKHDPRTGEATDDPPPAPSKPAPAHADGDDMIPCPVCGGPCYDNRLNKKNPKGPDIKCKSKECGNAIWLGSWRDDLVQEIKAAHDVEAIDAHERTRAEEAVATLSPAKLDSVQKWLADLAQNASV